MPGGRGTRDPSPTTRGGVLYQQYRRLRHGQSYGKMPFVTLLDILHTHQRIPGQGLGPFIWRHGPAGTATLYDYHMPRREGITPDASVGWSEVDWSIHAVVGNCPAHVLNVNTPDGIEPSYRQILLTLLTKGCVIPSACLDQWLGDDSRKWCDPQLRLSYRRDL